MLSVAESANLLGVSSARVRELIAEGTLPARKVGRAWVLREEDVAARLDAHRAPGRPRAGKGAMAGALDSPPGAARRDDLHEIYEACKEGFACCPTMAELTGIEDEEERAFRVALSEFFLRRKQCDLVRQGVY